MPELPAIEITEEQQERIHAAVRTYYGLSEDGDIESALKAIAINAVNAIVTQVEANALRNEMNEDLRGRLGKLHEGLPEPPEMHGNGPTGPPQFVQDRAMQRAEAMVAEIENANQAVTDSNV